MDFATAVFGRGGEPSAPETEFHDVCFRFPNSDALILDHISFKIKRGEKIALVGINGAGKTTLIKLVCGLFIPTDGYISVDGKNIAGFRADIDYERLNAR